MSREQAVRRYRELTQAQRAHEDQAAEDAKERARIVVELYDRFHLTCAEIAAELGEGLTAEEVEQMILAVTT